MNGIRVLNQAWECAVPAADVMAYYRGQMVARGWRDVTEETFNMKPEFRNQEMGENSLQSQEYLKTYMATIDSNLVLRRGNWFIQVNAYASNRSSGKTRVSIYAASTPTPSDFLWQLASSFGEGELRGNQPLDIVQENGGNRYRLAIGLKSASSTQAFQAALKDLGIQGWRPVMSLPKQRPQSGYFAWLVRGRHYAVLSVDASPEGSSVAFTEVSPASSGGQ